MKFLSLIFLLFFSITLSAQTFSGKVIDSLTNQPIEYANITLLNRDYETYSNSFGSFSIDVNEKDEILLISSVGYKNKTIALKDYREDKNTINVYLAEDVDLLDEVFISTKKLKYTSAKTLGLNKKLKARTSFPFGYEFTNYIANPYKKNGIVNTVIISLNKQKEYDYLASFNIKFYEYDTRTQKPGALIHHDNLIIHPENKTYKLTLDVEELDIPFLENGICIGVEILNTKYEEPTKFMAKMAPKINFTHTKEKKILTWSRFRNKDWKIYTRQSRARKKDFINGEINIEVKIEK